MSGAPKGNEHARPFLPAKDLALSKRFYEALGFEKVLDSEVVIFNTGSGGFILTTYAEHEDWARRCMMQLMVDDLDAWWAKIEAIDVQKTFGVGFEPRPPALQPWGLRIAYIADPTGVLWHIAERRPGKPQDR